MTLTTQSFSNLKEAWLGKAGQKVTLETGFIRLHPASCGFMWVHRFYGAFGAVPLGILKGFERSDRSELKIAWVITVTLGS